MTVALVPRLDVFRRASQTFVLSQTPVGGTEAPLTLVYLNGLLMVSPDDYTLSGTALTFTGQNVALMPAVVVQVLYWVAD